MTDPAAARSSTTVEQQEEELDYINKCKLVSSSEVQWNGIVILDKWPKLNSALGASSEFVDYLPRQTILLTKVEKFLEAVSSFRNHKSIAIDGMSGIGKTTLIKKTNRTYAKINLFRLDVTSSGRYNDDILRSLEYLQFHDTIMLEGTGGVMWDRCNLSNIIFLFVHQLMTHYGDNSMPIDPKEPWSVLLDRAVRTNLMAVINNVKVIPTLFMVCSDIDVVAINMMHRGTASDCAMANKYNYHMAQYHVYSFFAEMLNMPIIDLAQINISLDSFQNELCNRINYTYTGECKIEMGDVESHKQLLQISDKMDDVLVYAYSGK